MIFATIAVVVVVGVVVVVVIVVDHCALSDVILHKCSFSMVYHP